MAILGGGVVSYERGTPVSDTVGPLGIHCYSTQDPIGKARASLPKMAWEDLSIQRPWDPVVDHCLGGWDRVSGGVRC